MINQKVPIPNPPSETGRVAIGDDVPSSLAEPHPANGNEKSTMTVKMLDHRFWLRPGTTQVRFVLPADLTAKEAEKLGNYIKSLAE